MAHRGARFFRNSLLLFSSLAGVVGYGVSNQSSVTDPLESIAPYMLDYRGGEKALVRRLSDIRKRSGISRFLLGAPHNVVRIGSCVSPAEYAKFGEKIARINAALADEGIRCGFYAAPSMNMGKGRPGGEYVMSDGSKRPFTGCPADPDFRERLVANLKAMASACKPDRIIMEDDYRYFGNGCFCDRHLKAFSELEGLSAEKAYTRESLNKALMESKVASDAFRLRWHSFQTGYLVSLGREISAAVLSVSPETRIGLCAPGGFPEPDTREMAKALSGGKRPFIRWHGAFYGVDRPTDAFGVLRSAQWACENLADGHELVYEADTVPHNAYYASAARMCGLVEMAIFMGFERPLFWCVGDGEGDLETSPDYLDAYRRKSKRMAELRRIGRIGKPVGLQIAFDPHYRFRREKWAGRVSPADWYYALNRLGFPVTSVDSQIRFFSGSGAFASMSNKEIEQVLSGRVFLDGAAAEAARRRGFGSLIGVKTASYRPVDFTGEVAVDGSWHSSEFECTFHQNYGLDSARISNLELDGAKEISYYYTLTPEKRARPSIMRFSNSKGGRVSIMALNVGQARTPNLFCFPKRELIAAEIEWLGGENAVPVRVRDQANLYILARDTPEGLVVCAMNLSCDGRDELSFTVAEAWRGGAVEILDGDVWRKADASWSRVGDKNVLRIKAEVPVYDTCAFRLRNDVKLSAIGSASAPKDLSFKASFDGTLQRYVVIEPVKPAKGPVDALICLHGHGSDRHQFAVQKRGECRASREAAAARKMLFVSPDYRAKTSWMGPAAESDMLDLIALLRRERSVRRIFLCGGSMGGTSALTFAALHPEAVAGVTAFNPLADHMSYTNFQSAISASFGGDKKTAESEYLRRSALNFPERFTMPLSITLGGRDRTVPPESARALAKEIGALYPGNVYVDDDPKRGHETSYEASAKALREMFMRVDAADEVQPCDLVVYGATSAGIAAAVQAKRMGRSVVIVEPSYRIGGMTTGGLGQTDIGAKRSYGGIAREFYADVRKWYDKPLNWRNDTIERYAPVGQCAGSQSRDTMWTFEPSAALSILEGWIARNGIKVVKGVRLDRKPGGVLKRDGRIVSFRTEDGKEFKGLMFVDATYEGDLMAAAGVSYAVGRESNAKYGETLNGIQKAQSVYHQFFSGVDPYVVKGDPSSGLLPGVEPYNPGEKDGDGDSRLQAYCFRMCLTDVPGNRIPFEKPAGYDERDFELLFRDYEQRAVYPEQEKLYSRKGIGWINALMPCRKTDTNNRLAFSTDFIGANWEWPDASYERRQSILKAHLERQQGLMWTLANHPRIPAKVRNQVARWGMCRDEFLDPSAPGGGWQSQMYVREARRMVGEYVMTELDCRKQRKAPKPVAMGSYNMDSHHVRRHVGADGFVHNEGDVEVPVRKGPYAIAYGSITPRTGECSNLLVPVCLSASHIAYGSIRMEPVFFALGQVAGTAAALSILDGCAVQSLDYAKLSARLAADGQVFR